ncbi:hypothetical protein ACJJIQ_10955 [Microbulbifer sp. ANSA003]|uniref:hypothetical protein n=1 Tax=unclassified Microbulbifer TaxID=2619833 RepID=UPI00403A32A9
MKLVIPVVLIFLGVAMCLWGGMELLQVEEFTGNKYTSEGRDSHSGLIAVLIGLATLGYGLFELHLKRGTKK